MLGGRCATSHGADIDITSPRLKTTLGGRRPLVVAEEPNSNMAWWPRGKKWRSTGWVERHVTMLP